MTTVKTPFLASTSGWQPNVTWENSSVPLAGGLCRASLGTWLKDTVFANYWKQWRDMGIVRCAYHYLKNDYSTADQARFFVECLNVAGGWLDGDKLCLDVEDEYNLSISAVIDWLYNVELLTGVHHSNMLIYSRATVLDPLSFSKLSQAQRDYLLEVPIWTAGYPDNPDAWNFEQLKNAYAPDPLRYGETVIVQYAASIEIPGINPIEGRSTECNIADPSYLMMWMAETGTQPPPPNGGTMLYATNPSSLNLRQSPGTGAVIMVMPAGTSIEGTEIVTHTDGGKWLKTVKPQAGYCASWLLEYTTPPPTTGLPVITGDFTLRATGYPDHPVDIGEWKPL